MQTSIPRRIAELGLQIPSAPKPAANYVPFVRSGNIVYVSGQVSFDGTHGVYGIVGTDIDLEEAQRAARLCALNVLAQIKLACDDDWQRFSKLLKINGFVQASATFDEIPLVINGASNLFVEVFGEAGCHSRTATGAFKLPRNHAVEIDAVFELSI